MLTQRDKMFGEGEEYQMNEHEKEICKRLEEIKQEIRNGDYEEVQFKSVPGGFVFAFHECGPVGFDWVLRDVPTEVYGDMYDNSRY